MLSSFRNRDFILPFLLTFLLFLVMFSGDIWYLYDGSAFHLQNFIHGHLNNERDISRLGAMFLTDWWDLLYFWTGGGSFQVSRHIYVWGQTIHIFYPLFFLLYVSRDEEKREFVTHAMWFYVLSLFLTRAFCYFYLVNELHVAHTVSWLCIFALRSGPRYRAFHWTCAVFSIFTYPVTIYTLGVLFLREIADRRRALLYLSFAGLAAILTMEYLSRYPGPAFLVASFRRFHEIYTAHFYIVMFVLIFGVKEFFRGQRWLIVILGVAYYANTETFGFWQFYPGRAISVILIIVMEAYYLFRPQLIKELRPKTIAFSVLALFLMVQQNQRLGRYNTQLLELLQREKRVVTLEEGRRLMELYRNYVNKVTIRMHSIALEVMDDNKVSALIQKEKRSHFVDLIDVWGAETFRRRAESRGITFGENIDL